MCRGSGPELTRDVSAAVGCAWKEVREDGRARCILRLAEEHKGSPAEDTVVEPRVGSRARGWAARCVGHAPGGRLALGVAGAEEALRRGAGGTHEPESGGHFRCAHIHRCGPAIGTSPLLAAALLNTSQQCFRE
ncbi:unnamed protein product [Arctogadus glacialis]